MAVCCFVPVSSMHEVRKELFLKQVTTTEPARATKKTVHQSFEGCCYCQSYDAREKDGGASESAYYVASCNAAAASASASLLRTTKGEK